MSHRIALVLAGMVALGAVAPPASAKDDPAEIKKRREVVRAEYKEKKKAWPFFDLSYYVDAPQLEDSRWTVTDPPPFNGVKESEGAQFYATWAPAGSAEGGFGIRVVVRKMPHSAQNGSTRSVFNLPFNNAGKTVSVSDWKEMVEMWSLDWKKGATDPVEKASVSGKKRKVGPAEHFASATATDADSKKRERRDVYGWSTPNITWIATVDYDQAYLDKPEILEKGELLIKNIKELKDKRVD